MFERPKSGERAVVVQINYSASVVDKDTLAEFQELALSAGAIPLATITTSKQVPDPKYFVGQGKAFELKATVQTVNAGIVLINHALSPAQQRNLEQLLQCRVVDRTGLILDIFAQRARTFEGKLQVELAQLQHMATRLVKGWTHLERQKGGIGLRGPGETQLETDRRLIKNRIKHLTQRLERVKQQRSQGRRARQRSVIPTIALVGYTNAGKSTLFNQLTQANVRAVNQLFATLDPVLRRVELKDGLNIILADTVGFIKDLPHDLVQAFRATLEETQSANLLLHVIDAQSTAREEQMAQVNLVLKQIEAEQVPQLWVYNKIDQLEDREPRIDYSQEGKPRAVWLSALTGAGIDLLWQAVTELLSADMVEEFLILEPENSRWRAKLYELSAIQKETIDELGRYHLWVRLNRREFAKLVSQIKSS